MADHVRAQLRPTTEADIDYVTSLEARGEVRPFIAPWSRQQHRQALVDGDTTHLISVIGGERRGFAILVRGDARDTVELRRLVVWPHGRGHGRATMRAVIAWAGAHGADRIWLDVLPDNERAIALYQSEGFAPRRFAAAPPTMGDGRVLLVMERGLRDAAAGG